jgi:hypothetical protein
MGNLLESRSVVIRPSFVEDAATGERYGLSVARRSANSRSMNLHHRVALALVGWYLMTPPVVRSGFVTAEEPSAPKSTWNIQRSFNTSAECHSARNKFLADPDKNVFYPAESAKTVRYKSLSKRKVEAECIASDDPRLKSN